MPAELQVIRKYRVGGGRMILGLRRTGNALPKTHDLVENVVKIP